MDNAISKIESNHNYVDENREKRHEKSVAFTKFINDYKSTNTNVFYGFVEGKDDPSYYRTIIKNKLPENYKIFLYPCDGKSNVKYAYNKITIGNFQKERITFYMDRDLSDLIEDENIIRDSCVYITDKYSIENDIITDYTFESVLRDIMGFVDFEYNQTEKLKEIFISQKKSFENLMIPIMANIISWKRKKIKNPLYRNVKIKKLFYFNIENINYYLSKNDAIKVLYNVSKIDYDEYYNSDDEKNIVDEIEQKNLSSHILRGKYLSDFFVEYCNIVSQHYEDKRNVKYILGTSQFCTLVAPRSIAPESLKKFIKENILNNINR